MPLTWRGSGMTSLFLRRATGAAAVRNKVPTCRWQSNEASSSSSSSSSSFSSSRDEDDDVGGDDNLSAERAAVSHHRNHPRVSIPYDLGAHDLGTRPFPAPVEPCSAEDAQTMLRQIRKRRAYPLGACHRCKHGYPQAYLHAPMHIPASAAAAFVRLADNRGSWVGVPIVFTL